MKSHNREVALLAALIFLILHVKSSGPWLELTFACLVAGILVPFVFALPTKLLLWLGPKVQKAATPIILNGIYFLMVFPIGLTQKALRSSKSDFHARRTKRFTKEDLERPF